MLASFPDLLIIGGAALLVFGPKRLPELAKALGSGIRDFKKAMEGIDEPKASVPPAQSPPTLVSGGAEPTA
jgi:sec-independent protein translocase protein TatA